MQPLQFRQLAGEPVTEWAFWSQFFEEVFSVFKRICRKISILEQTSPTTRNFAFSQQGNAPY